MVLGIETATAACSAGLVDGARSFVRTIREDRVHSEKLLTLVAEVLREAGATMTDVEAVAVSSGPGSFTGLRIGASTAKGLVAPHRRRLVGVPTMAVAAASARARGRLTRGGLLLLDARQGEWYAAECGAEGTLGPVEIRDEAWVRHRATNADVLTDRPERFPEAASAGDIVEYLSGDVVATLGHERLSHGAMDDVTTFEPMYLKAFVVRTPSARGR